MNRLSLKYGDISPSIELYLTICIGKYSNLHNNDTYQANEGRDYSRGTEGNAKLLWIYQIFKTQFYFTILLADKNVEPLNT